MPLTQIDDIKVYYEVTGQGEPLLFIHGLGSNGRDWGPQVEAFQDRYLCITYDVRGHGRSDKPSGPYSVRQFVTDATGLLQHLGISSAHLVGLSLGGMIAFQMAVDAPQYIKSMVIINSGPAVPMRTLKEKAAVWQRLVLFRFLSMERIGRTIGKRLFPNPDQAEMLDYFISRWVENDKSAYMNATRALAGWDVSKHLSTITTPTLVIAADQDYTPVEAKASYVAQMPNAELVVVKDARHAVNFAQPDKVNPLIATFLEKVTVTLS